MTKEQDPRTRTVDLFEYAFTRNQVQNMIIFMNRTKLDGQEVPAFNEIMGILHNQPNAKPFALRLLECDKSILIKELERRQMIEEKQKKKEEALLAANKPAVEPEIEPAIDATEETKEEEKTEEINE